MTSSLKRFTGRDFESFQKEYRRNFVNCLSGFKSLCLCGTSDPEGGTNLSLISSVIHVGANPPLMAMLMRPVTVQRDTVENIIQTGVFTLNHVQPDILNQAHQSSARYPSEISEFDVTGLTPVVYEGFSAPFVKESALRIGLKFRERHVITTNATMLIVGEIVVVETVDDAVGSDGFIDLEKLRSMTVSGLDSYHNTNRVKRLSYAKPDQAIQEI